MSGFVRTRLSAMMFVFYASLGAWAVTTATYLLSPPTSGGLAFTTGQVGWIYSTFALGSVLANPLVGLLADRYFAAERVFGTSVFICGLIIITAGWWCQSCFPEVQETYLRVMETEVDIEKVNDHPEVRAAVERVFMPFFGLMLAQSIAMQISLTLTTVISMRNLADPGHEFSRIRMWGTIGWVAVGLLMGFIVDIRSPQPFYLAGVLALIVGIYGWTLPHTPPKGGGKTLAESFGLPAFQLFRDRSFVVFVLIAYIASMINQFYGVYGHQLLTDLKISQPERWMTIGQAFEIAVMFTIPLLQPKRWLKWLMLLGLMGWILRGVALMTGSKMFALCLAVPMHGWSYAFFYIVAAIYIDREAPPHLRASTQAILAFVAGGLGPWTGNLLAAWVVDQHRTGNVTDWPAVWLLPTIICTISAIVYVFCFHPPPE